MKTRSRFRLLVVRLGAMGDILHALPAVTGLRQAHPNWVIDWVVEPRWSALLAAEGSGGRGPASLDGAPNPQQPVVDRLIFAATKEWRQALFSRQTVHQFQALRQALRDGAYDATLDLQGALRSAILAHMACKRRRIGEAEPREAAAAWLSTDLVSTHSAHVIEQDVELAAAIAGDELHPLRPWIPVDSAAEAWAEKVLPRASADRAILLNPGAGWGAKRWPVERYAAVARDFCARGFRILINTGPGEEPLAEAILKETGSAALALNATLAQLIAITRRVALAIAGDTGPLHLACALGRPVVGIYGPTDPSRNGPFGARFKVLRSPESRRDHTRYQAPEYGLLTIQPADVLRAAEELLYSENAPEPASESCA